MKKLFSIFTLLVFSIAFLFAKSNKKINVLEFYKACATGNEEYVASVLKNEPNLINATLSEKEWKSYLKFYYNEVKQKDKQFNQTFEEYFEQNLYSYSFPLYAAAFSGNIKIVSLLVEYGTDVNKTTGTGRTAISCAASWGHKDIVEYLFTKEANINIKDNNGISPLMMASAYGWTDVVAFLLDNNADINTKDKDGRTPLMAASYFGNKDVVKLLLDNGADLNIKDNENYTALVFAAMQNKSNIIELLQEKQENTNKNDIIEFGYKAPYKDDQRWKSDNFGGHHLGGYYCMQICEQSVFEIFYGLRDLTPLKKEAFKESEEGKQLIAAQKRMQEFILNEEVTCIEEIQTSKYDMTKKGFYIATHPYWNENYTQKDFVNPAVWTITRPKYCLSYFYYEKLPIVEIGTKPKTRNFIFFPCSTQDALKIEQKNVGVKIQTKIKGFKNIEYTVWNDTYGKYQKEIERMPVCEYMKITIFDLKNKDKIYFYGEY